MKVVNQTSSTEVQELPEVIDLEAYTKSSKKPPVGKRYKVKIDGKSFVFDHHLVTREELLRKAGYCSIECFVLYQKFKGCDFEKIGAGEKIDLTKPGIEKFTVKPTDIFHYSVDGEPETTDSKQLSPNQILDLAGVTPVSDYYLVQVDDEGNQTSFKDTPDVPIEMQCPAMKFISVFRGETPVS